MHNIPGQIGKILMADSEPILEDTDIYKNQPNLD